ncbi:MAG: hypothetical protein ACE5OT_05525 [Candidatus Hadarchaeaceae archaeon]
MVDKTFAKKLGIKKNQLVVCLNVDEKILNLLEANYLVLQNSKQDWTRRTDLT